MTEKLIDVSREFFSQEVLPVLQAKFPQETARIAFGLFGHGSEALRMDDAYSADHHFGLRIDALMPAEIFENKREEIMRVVGAGLPRTFKGYELGESTRAGAGIAPDNFDDFLIRTIGIDHPPQTSEEWLNLPEEDIVHLINGEVWFDQEGKFSAIRESLNDYYPDQVWKRRMAHWCRYISGMGSYALKRAILRDNDLYAVIAFGKTIRWSVQLAFMLDRTYYPYDKWLFDFFTQLPRMYGRLGDLVTKCVKLTTPWDEKLNLLDEMADILDQTMVEDGIIPPHPPYVGTPTSGYRLMENAYQDILSDLPEDIKYTIPVWDQVYMEKFVVRYVDSIDKAAWLSALNLSPVAAQPEA
jgi:hypothetical protein